MHTRDRLEAAIDLGRSAEEVCRGRPELLVEVREGLPPRPMTMAPRGALVSRRELVCLLGEGGGRGNEAGESAPPSYAAGLSACTFLEG